MPVGTGEEPSDLSPSAKQPAVSQWIKRKIEAEGVQARNIIKYNVPMDNPNDDSKQLVHQSGDSVCSGVISTLHTKPRFTWCPQSPRAAVSPELKKHHLRGTAASSVTTSSTTSANVSSGHRRRIESEYRARYWGQMLDTLRRTIDEIYSACETDESEVECKEVIMILEHSKQDFHSLIEKMNLLREFEQADDGNKPSALAWDERTTLPGKPIMNQLLASTQLTVDGQSIAASLSFSQEVDSPVRWLRIPHERTRDIYREETDAVTPTSRLPIKVRVSCSGLSGSEFSSNKDVEELADDDEDIAGDVEDEPDQNVYPVDTEDSLLCSPGGEHIPDESFLSDVDDEGEVTQLSRDLRQLDEAIANVTSAERVLTSRLDRAQYAEAALRRRLLNHQEHPIDDDEDEDVANIEEVETQPDTSGALNDPEDAWQIDPSTERDGLGMEETCCACRCHTRTGGHVGESARYHLAPLLCTSSPVEKSKRAHGDPLSRTIPTPTDHLIDQRSNGSSTVNGHQSPDLQHSLMRMSRGGAAAAKATLFLSDLGVVKSRTPGHGVQMHEKLSARSQKKSNSSMHELEQKQTRAQILRKQHLLERAERVHELSKKVEEVHLQKRLLLMQRRSCLERRLHAAERKRKEELDKRVSKAHDEETKGKEIAFIQTLEAEQKQHTIFTKHQESRARLGEIAAQRRRRLEEKLGRREAAKGRRRALEASRRARLDALQARWESKTRQLASRAERLEHTRRAAAKAKEQHREIKIASLEEQQRVHIEQLRCRIQRKQEETERRHQESLREISRKAFEMSVLTHSVDESTAVAGMDPYPVQKWCRACQVTIVSEVSLKSHLQGKRHQRAVLEANKNRPFDRSDLEAFNLLHLVDAPPDLQNPLQLAEQERVKMRRKRARKLRQRMNQRAQQFAQQLEQVKPSLTPSANRVQLQKLVKDARRLLNLPDSGPWVITRVQAMEKTLNAILRCISSSVTRTNGFPCDSTRGDDAPPSDNKQLCVQLGLLPLLLKLLGLIREQRATATQLLPDRTYHIACEVLSAVCQSCSMACDQMLWSNGVSVLVDCILTRFSLCALSFRPPSGNSINKDEAVDSAPPFTSTNVASLMNCLTVVLTDLSFAPKQTSKRDSEDCVRIQDFLSYVVCSGMVDLIASRLSSPRQANLLLYDANEQQKPSNQAQRFVLSSVALLTALVQLLGRISRTRLDHHRTRQPSPDESSGGCKTDRSCSESNVKRFDSVSSRDTTQDSSITRTLPSDPTTTHDPTKLIETILSTEVFGLIPLLYCLLLDPTERPSTGRRSTDTMADGSRFRSPAVAQITLQSLMLLNAFAMVDQTALQSLLSSELTCLLMRHILLALLSRCSPGPAPTITPQPHIPGKERSASRKTNSHDELDDLLPSGSRQVVVVRRSESRISGGKSRPTPLPDWADEVTSTERTVSRTAFDSSSTDTQLTEAILHETILCIGHLCSMHPDNQINLQFGRPSSLLQHMIRLPFEYFSQSALSDILYPTLIACCYGNEENRKALQAELSPTLLANYIEERSLERTMKALSHSGEENLTSSEFTDTRFHLEHRVPVREWDAAKAYFAATC